MKIDPSKIKGPYQLLAFLIFSLEAILGLWMYYATDSTERIVAGILMAIVLIVLMIVIIFIRRTDNSSISPQGLQQVTPAKEEVSEEQIETPGPEQIAGPYGRYIINKPPEDWSVNIVHSDDWVTETMGIKDPAIKKQRRGSPFADNILSLISKHQDEILPTPGVTKINGRIFYSALKTSFQTELTILDVERLQPPYYFEGNLENSTMVTMTGIMLQGSLILQSISSGYISASKRKHYTFELVQHVNNATINGEPNKDCSYRLTVICIEGEVRDHLLIMRYILFPSLENTSNKERDTLASLVNSFQPLKLLNPEKEKQKILAEANRLSADVWKNFGGLGFSNEMNIYFQQLSGKNLDDKTVQEEIIEQMNVFEVLAKELNLKEKELDAIWFALEKAKKGNFDLLKKGIQEFIKSVKKEPEKS